MAEIQEVKFLQIKRALVIFVYKYIRVLFFFWVNILKWDE